MKFQGDHVCRAPRDDVWAAVMNPRAELAKLPGFQRFDTIGDHEYEGDCEIAIGDVEGDFQGTIKLGDLKPPASLRFFVNGMGAAGFVDGEGLLVLEEESGGTRIHYDLDAKLGGRIGAVDQSALADALRALARRAMEGLEVRKPAARVRLKTRQEASAPKAEPQAPAPAPNPPRAEVSAAESPEPVKAPDPPESAGTADTEPEAAAASPEATSGAGAPVLEPVPVEPEPSAKSSPSRNPGPYGSQVARGLSGPLVPERMRSLALGAALLLYTITVVLITRACSG